MTTTPHTPRIPSWKLWVPLGIDLFVVLVLGTIGTLGIGFGIATNCTNFYSCTESDCSPCDPSALWWAAGWWIQLALFLTTVALIVFVVRRYRLRQVQIAAWLIVPLSIIAIVVTTLLAEATIG